MLDDESLRSARDDCPEAIEVGEENGEEFSSPCSELNQRGFLPGGVKLGDEALKRRIQCPTRGALMDQLQVELLRLPASVV